MPSDPSPAEPLVERIDLGGDPIDRFRRLAGGHRPFLLLSGTAAEGRGRYSILGCDPFAVWSPPAAGGDPFAALEQLARRFPTAAAGDLPFAGGLVGYLGYECCRFVEAVPVRPAGAGDPPDARFAAYAAAAVIDGRSGEAFLLATGWPEPDPPARRAAARRQMEALRARLLGEAPPPGPPPTPAGEAVRRVLDHIRAGDIYQANLTQRLDLPVRGGDAVELFARLHAASPAPHAAFLDLGGWKVLSSSPERFLSLSGGVVESRPIKGTAPRGAGADQDRRRLEALRASPKDRAENLMIVDLVRNDLNRVCRDVHVAGLAEPETYATLHHLVSTVRGRLAPGRGAADLLRAAFPPGSMTGAPKVRAIEILHRLEPVRRGPYAGGLGYLSFDGRLDLSVVIRTILLGGGVARFHVGGGVVADSDPDAEYEESLWKARALRAALGSGA
jgi:para-aminobenzoate synthetase component 1